jgi:hypothetical protein
VVQILPPRVLLAMNRNHSDEEVICSAVGDRRSAPDGDVAGSARVAGAG